MDTAQHRRRLDGMRGESFMECADGAEQGTEDRLRRIEALLQRLLQSQSEGTKACDSALSKPSADDAASTLPGDSKGKDPQDLARPSTPQIDTVEAERLEERGASDGLFGRKQRVDMMPRDARLAELQAIEFSKMRRLSEDYAKQPPLLSQLVPARRPSLATIMKMRRGSMDVVAQPAGRFQRRGVSEDFAADPRTAQTVSRRRPSFCDTIASGSRPLEDSFRLYALDNSDADSATESTAGLGGGDAPALSRAKGAHPPTLSAPMHSCFPRRSSLDARRFSNASVSFDARRLSNASITSFQSAIHSHPHLSPHSPGVSPAWAAGQHARKTMEELHAIGNAIGSGGPDTATRDEELRSLVRWDVQVGSLLDQMKQEQLSQMQEDEALKASQPHGSRASPAACAGRRARSRRESSRGVKRLSAARDSMMRSSHDSHAAYSRVTDTSELTRPRRFILTAGGAKRRAIE